MDVDGDIEEILCDIGLGSYVDQFVANNITPKDVVSLSDDEFNILGITAIGDRVRLREKCKASLKANQEEYPVLTRIREFQNRRKSKRLVTNNRKPKETRRIYIGWKQWSKNVYRLVPEGKGGGIHNIDVSKSANLSELSELIANKYFPDGKNDISGIELIQINYFLATFTGRRLRQTLGSGREFSLGDFLEEFNSSPVRLYIHTKTKTESDTECNTDPSFDNTTSTSLPIESYSSSDEFQDTGTPTITFNLRRRRRLRLNRTRATEMQSCTLSAPAPGLQPSISSDSPPRPELFTSPVTPPAPQLSTLTASSSGSQPSTPSPPQTGPQTSSSFETSTGMQSTSSASSTLLPLPSTTSETQETVVVISLPEDQDTDVIYDSEIQDAIKQSLENTGPVLTLEGIIKWWQESCKITVEDPKQLLISRSDLLKSTLRLVKRESFNFCENFQINFSGEDGDDFGGPSREFLRILVHEVCDSILQGADTEKFFRHDLEKLSSGYYELSGKLVAFSLLHGGPGIPLLHPIVYNYLINGDTGMDTNTSEELPSIDSCVFDIEVREKLLALQNAKDQTEYTEQVSNIAEWCFEQGLAMSNFWDITGRDKLLRILKMNEIYYRVQSEIVQFRNGLNKVGRLFDAIKLAPSECSPLFVDTKKPLRFRDLKQIYSIDWSPEGSNSRAQETRAIYCLEAFFADCEGGATGIKLEDVLAFWTGAKRIPPLGFGKQLEISFGNTKQLPTAHTCGLVLVIWRGFQDPDEFEEAMKKAIEWAGGFHLA